MGVNNDRNASVWSILGRSLGCLSGSWQETFCESSVHIHEEGMIFTLCHSVAQRYHEGWWCEWTEVSLTFELWYRLYFRIILIPFTSVSPTVGILSGSRNFFFSFFFLGIRIVQKCLNIAPCLQSHWIFLCSINFGQCLDRCAIPSVVFAISICISRNCVLRAL